MDYLVFSSGGITKDFELNAKYFLLLSALPGSTAGVAGRRGEGVDTGFRQATAYRDMMRYRLCEVFLFRE